MTGALPAVADSRLGPSPRCGANHRKRVPTRSPIGGSRLSVATCLRDELDLPGARRRYLLIVGCIVIHDVTAWCDKPIAVVCSHSIWCQVCFYSVVLNPTSATLEANKPDPHPVGHRLGHRDIEVASFLEAVLEFSSSILVVPPGHDAFRAGIHSPGHLIRPLRASHIGNFRWQNRAPRRWVPPLGHTWRLWSRNGPAK